MSLFTLRSFLFDLIAIAFSFFPSLWHGGCFSESLLAGASLVSHEEGGERPILASYVHLSG